MPGKTVHKAPGMPSSATIDGLSILESDSLKRLIREEIKLSQEPIWKQFTNWQFYTGAAFVFAALTSIFSWDYLSRPLAGMANSFLGTQKLIEDGVYKGTLRSLRTSYNFTGFVGDGWDYEFDKGMKCEENLVMDAFNQKKFDGCPVFVSRSDDQISIPITPMPGQYVHLEVYLAQKTGKFQLEKNCSSDVKSKVNRCVQFQEQREPQIDDLVAKVDGVPLIFSAGTQSFAIPSMSDVMLFSHFRARQKLVVDQSKPISRIAEITFQPMPNKERISLFTLVIVATVTYEKDYDAMTPTRFEFATKEESN